MGNLKHVEVDGPGRAYLFFYDWHGYRGLPKEEASGHAFPHCRCIYRVDWEIRTFRCGSPIARSRMNNVRVSQCKRGAGSGLDLLKEPVLPVPANESTSSGSSQLVGWSTHGTRNSGGSDMEQDTP